ncbi:type IV pilus twitching motility protein PilT [Hydrogenobacter sp. T-2]|uniref:type IV pilus twitching motility protein PilT n=1 Tax=Pampinifervens diazotrophicum TaxID=1632018 RepID=UPI002B25A3D6|nr:type IV pilus twitching motility protein PilT [Hydrogenobacter sp. T-2]WPM32773.1 type IV pilus twitching motility protein PilT [Hydrogenobacter sp. T-2]
MTPTQKVESLTQSIKLTDILYKAVQANASDVHITAGARPSLRIDGKITQLVEYPILTPDITQTLAYSVMSERHRKTLEEKGQVDFSFGVKDLARFRANVFYQRGSIAAVFRRLPSKILSIKDLGLSDRVLEVCHKSMGLVLVTGPTGSGKTTTLAALINYINENFPHHIITIEDPIEYVFQHRKSIVNQREIGEDVHSFADALRAALREDPDVILVGEMRDLETIEIALRAAETGHLVFGTLHTNTAISTITRIIDVFPPEQQEQVRVQLSFVLQGVISQRLLPKIGGGRVLAYELMIPNTAIRNLIRENKLQQIYAIMQSGQAQTGMQTMNQSLYGHYRAGLITLEDAYKYSPDIKELERMTQRGG